MKLKYFLLAFFLLGICSISKADTTTNRFGLTIPTIGSPTWGQKINGNFQILDATVAALGQFNVFNTSVTFNKNVLFNSTVNWQNLRLGTGQCLGIDSSSHTVIVPCGSTSTFNVMGTPITNYTIIYNGTDPQWAPAGTSFDFSIASFGDSLAGNQRIGTGVWKSTGSVNFTASYSNGPPIGSTITFSGWSALPLSFPFTSVASVANVNYPSVGGTVVFVMSAQKNSIAMASITHSFNNDRYWGVSSQVGVYVSSNVTTLSNNDLTNSVPNIFTVSPGAGQYIVYSYPNRLGTATFSVGGFAGGFNPPQTLSVTNSNGFSENYYMYRSVNSNLGSTTVTVTTP